MTAVTDTHGMRLGAGGTENPLRRPARRALLSSRCVGSGVLRCTRRSVSLSWGAPAPGTRGSRREWGAGRAGIGRRPAAAPPASCRRPEAWPGRARPAAGAGSGARPRPGAHTGAGRSGSPCSFPSQQQVCSRRPFFSCLPSILSLGLFLNVRVCH